MQHIWPGAHLPVVLAGPTATGKTAAAIALAALLDAEIINADSMQVYRGMDIGTAKPDAQERASTRFHLLDVVAPDQGFTVADWKVRAEAAIADIAARGKRTILCGGTGLYIRALLDDWTLAETPANPVIRERLKQEAEALGSSALHRRLAEVDREAAVRLHPNDTVRIVRALEVYEASGKTLSAYQAEDRATRQPRPAHYFGLTLPRPALYSRIEARVDAMIAGGLENEVRGLLAQGFAANLSPMRSLGYKEMVSYIHGEFDLETTRSSIKQSTRRYAKRQQTWFHADTRISWLDVSTLNSVEVAENIQRALSTKQTQVGSVG